MNLDHKKDVRTHYKGCWEERGHHDCAERRIAFLERQLAEARALAEWTLISSENPVRLGGDELLDPVEEEVCSVADYRGDKVIQPFFTYRRPLNLPQR